MPKYKVKSPLSHDNKDYAIGATVEMTEEQAQPLLGHTLARPGEELTEKQVSQGVSAVETEAARLAELREELVGWKGELDAAYQQLQADAQKLTQDQAELAAGREQLAADRADFEKTAKAAAKK